MVCPCPQDPTAAADAEDAPKDEERRDRRRQDGDEPPSYDDACGAGLGAGRLCRLASMLGFGTYGPSVGPFGTRPDHSPLSPFCGCVACAVPGNVMPPTVAATVQPPSYEEYMLAVRRGPGRRLAPDPLSSANFCVRAGRIFGTGVGRRPQGSDEPPAPTPRRSFDEAGGGGPV